MASGLLKRTQLYPTQAVCILKTMKIKSLLVISALAMTLQSGPAVLGQDSDQMGAGQRGRRSEQMANLSPQDRQKLEAARQKAMADPTVQAAHEKVRQAQKEFHDAMRAAMLRADPSIQAILDKMPERAMRNRRDF
jgi:hypothetical protein